MLAVESFLPYPLPPFGWWVEARLLREEVIDNRVNAGSCDRLHQKAEIATQLLKMILEILWLFSVSAENVRATLEVSHPGLFAGAGANARITDMWAGVSCVAR